MNEDSCKMKWTIYANKNVIYVERSGNIGTLNDSFNILIFVPFDGKKTT